MRELVCALAFAYAAAGEARTAAADDARRAWRLGVGVGHVATFERGADRSLPALAPLTAGYGWTLSEHLGIAVRASSFAIAPELEDRREMLLGLSAGAGPELRIGSRFDVSMTLGTAVLAPSPIGASDHVLTDRAVAVGLRGGVRPSGARSWWVCVQLDALAFRAGELAIATSVQLEWRP